MMMTITYFLNLLVFITYACIMNLDFTNPTKQTSFSWINKQVFGVYSRYAPMMPTSYVGSIFNVNFNSSFLYSFQFQNGYQIIAYVSFLFSDLKIQHIIQFQNQAEQILQKEIIDIDYLNYEGRLIATQFQLNLSSKQLILSVQVEEFTTLKYIQNINFSLNNIQFNIGGTMSDHFLTYFPGDLYYLVGCQNFNEYNTFYQNGRDPSCSYYDSFPDIDFLHYQAIQPLLLTPNPLVYEDYSINFWNLIDKSTKFISNGVIQLISVNLIQPRIGIINYGSDTFRMEINIHDDQISTIQLFYYSYQFPLTNFNQDYIASSIQSKTIGNIKNEQLTEWHHVEIIMKQKILKLNLFFPKSGQEIQFLSEKVYQFSYTQFSILIGSSNLQIFDGQMVKFSFNPCYSDGTFVLKCHYSCLDCFGPFADNCQSCNSKAYRELDVQKNTCRCKQFYTEINQSNCLYLQDYYDVSYRQVSNQLGFEQLEPEIICAYGYFLYDDNCIQCPSANQNNYLVCEQCLGQWKTWVFNPICNYSDSQVDIYVLHQYELIPCNYCYQICNNDQLDWNCYRFKYDHLNQPFYMKCLFYDYDEIEQICISHNDDIKNLQFISIQYLSQDYCAYYYNGQCQQCKFTNQFILYDRSHCQDCSIKNCKRCYQYRSVGSFISTLELYDIYANFPQIQLNDDYELGCALCEDGYFYNQILNECLIIKVMEPDCLSYFIDKNQNLVCLKTNLQDFSKGIEIINCDNIISNCYSCVRISENRIICTKCLPKYYLTNFLSCGACPQNSYDCYYDTRLSSQRWQFQIQPFYVYEYDFRQAYNFNWAVYNSRQYAFVIKCIQGYYQDPNKNQCVNYAQPNNCLQNVQSNCYQCVESDNYQFEFQLYNNNCLQCSHQCYLCSDVLSNCLLTDFTQYYISQTTRAVYPIIENIYRYKLQFQINTTLQNSYFFEKLIKSQIFYLHQPQQIILNLYEINPIQNYLLIDDYLFSFFKSIEKKQLNLYFTDQQSFQVEIKEYDSVNIYNYYLNLDQLLSIEQNSFLIKSENGLILKFENLTIQKKSDITNNYQNQIIINNCKILLIKSLLLSNVTTQNETIFDISVDNDSNIDLQNITFYNSRLINVTIFSLVHQNIRILNITFFNCTLENFFLFKIQDSVNININFEISIINIVQCQLQNFTILSENEFDQITIKNFTISNSSIKESQLIKSFSSLILNEIIFHNNLLQTFQLACSNSSLGKNLIFNNFKSTQDIIIDSLIFEINFQIETISFMNIMFSETKISNIIFQIQSQQIQILNYIVEKFSGFHILILKSNQILINNVILRESIQEKSQVDNFHIENQLNENKFITIQSFQNLNIYDCHFDRIYTKDNSILAINSELSGSLIDIKNLSFSNCFLLQTNNFAQVSLLAISTTRVSEIRIIGLNCVNIFTITRKYDQFGSQTALLYIVSQQGSVNLQNISLQDNYVSNSTNGLLYLEALLIHLTMIKNINSNIYRNQDLSFQDFIPKLNDNQVFNKLYEITSLGGVNTIKCESLIMKNVESINTTAAQGGFSYIQLNLQCSIQISEIKMSNTQAIDSRSIGGSFYIECQSNNLELIMSHVDIENSTSILNGGFLYLVPSAIKNTLQISNIICKGVNSIASSFLDLRFETISTYHKVFIQNVQYQFSFSHFQKFSIQNQKISSQDFKLFTENNGFIVIQNGIVTLDNLQFFGDVLLQPIYYLVSNQKLIMKNNQIYFKKQLSQYCLFFQSSEGQYESSFIFQNILIKQMNDHSFQSNFISQVSLQNKTLFEQFTSNLQPIVSLITIVSSNQIFKLKISYIQILYINQGVYQQSLVNILTQNQESIRIEQLFLIKNICTQESCISIKSQNKGVQQSNNIIKRSYIISNEKQNYGSFNFQYINFQIRDSIYLHNAARLQGGAIYYEYYSFSIIENSIFFNNTANEGGAIFSKQIIQNQIQNNLFLQNFAKVRMNNYGQSYYQLKLVENYFQEKNKKQRQLEEIENQQIIIINLPSGQMIKDYEIFNKSSQKFAKLDDYQLNLIVISQFQEQQILEDNFQCEIIEKLVNKKFDLISNLTNQRIIQADLTSDIFNLNEQIFIKNPYEETFLQINIQCNSLQLPNYTYTFYINTYECQIGEYFYQDQCLQCNSEQGFYNLDPKNSDCQKINTNIIKNNNKSLLELYPQYWRPNIFSDDISLCRNNPQNCIGGVNTGDNLCENGHIGALCEECDLYDTRGTGYFSKNSNYSCSSCGDDAIINIKFIFISIWILFQINLAVKSTQQQNKTYLLYKISTKFYSILFKQQQDQSSSIFKLILNYFQIIQIIQTFQINFQFSLAGVFNFIGNSSYSISYDFDCYLSKQSAISIIYLNLIWMISLPIGYYLVYIFINLLFKQCRLVQYSKETLYSSQQYLIISLKANIVNQLISLMTPRTISGISWISRNVSYLYFNKNHILIILYGLIPLLLFFSVTIPAIYFFLLTKNKNRFTSYVFKQKYGYIYNEYKNENFFWELIKLLKRELIIIILIVFQENVALKGIFLLLVLQIYYLIFLKNKPYNLRRLNQFEHKFLTLCIFVFLLSSACYEFKIQNISLTFIFQILIQAFLIILILESIYQIIWITAYNHNKSIERIINLLHKIFELNLKLCSCGTQYFQNRRKKTQRNKEILQQIRLLVQNGYFSSLKSNSFKQIKTITRFSKFLSNQESDVNL